MGEKIQLKMTVTIPFETDRDYYPEGATVEEIARIKEGNATDGELIEVLLSSTEFEVKIEKA